MAAPALLLALLTLVITVGSLGAVVERSLPSVTSSSLKIAPHEKESPKSTHPVAKIPVHHLSTRDSSRPSSERKSGERIRYKAKKSKTSKHVDSKASHRPTPSKNELPLATVISESFNAAQRSEISAVVAGIKSDYPPISTTHPSSRPIRLHLSPFTAGIFGPITGRPSPSSRATTSKGSNGAVVPIAAVVPVAAGLAGVVPVLPPPALPIDQSAPEHLSTPSRRETISESPSSSRYSATSSSSLSSAPSPSLWVIIPKNGHDAANNGLTAELTGIFGKELRVSQNELSGVVFWRAPLDSTQVRQYKASPLVSAVLPDATTELSGQRAQRRGVYTRGKSKRKDDQPKGKLFPSINLQPRTVGSTSGSSATVTDFVTQHRPSWDLIRMSQPKARRLPSVDYIYDISGGKGSTVYILDSGANIDNKDYKNMPGEKKWIFIAYGDTGISDTDKDDNDQRGHGTCVLSKVAGATFGVAKNADVVIVKIPMDFLKEPVSYILDAWSETADDIIKRQVKNAVINMSSGWPVGTVEPEFDDQLKKMIVDLINYGVIIVLSSGNTGGEVNSFPAVLAATLPIITVGAVDINGETWWKTSGGNLMTVTAPGVNVQCAGLKTDITMEITGTSFAAPAVAGLAAYLLSVEKFQAVLKGNGKVSERAQNMKDLIVSLAYIRGFGSQKSVYNGIDWVDETTCQSNPVLPRRKACSAIASKRPSAVATKPIEPLPPHSALPLLYSPSVAPPPPPKSSQPSVSSPTILDCVTCEASCVGFTGRCTAACLLPEPGVLDQCGPCISASSFGNQTCIDCVPKCPRSKLNGGIDCTDKGIFQPCNTNVIGQLAYPGLCTMKGFERKLGPPVSECLVGLVCDSAVGNTLNCLAAPAA